MTEEEVLRRVSVFEDACKSLKEACGQDYKVYAAARNAPGVLLLDRDVTVSITKKIK